MGVVFARYCGVAGLVFLLAALLAMPMATVAHPHGDGSSPPGYDCDHEPRQSPSYDFCHSPEFRPENDGQRTFELNNDTVLGTYFQGSLPRATDEDHNNRGNPTMVYTLRDASSPEPRDYDAEPSELGDAEGFRVNKLTDGVLRLRTIHGYDYSKNSTNCTWWPATAITDAGTRY